MEYRLLIVDDQRDLVAALRNQFFARGYEVMSANDGAAAIDIVNKSAFDVILLDVEMPGPSGLEVLAHVKKRQPEAKVIVMTGHGDYGPKARELGCDLFLSKPFIFNELEKSVTSLLNRKDYDEVKLYSIHGQMTRAPRGASVADILLIEPIDLLADAIATFLQDSSKAGGHYRVYKVDSRERAVILQSSLFIQIALVDLRTNQNPEAAVKALMSCDKPPAGLIFYFEPQYPIDPATLAKGIQWTGNPLEEASLRELADLIRAITKEKGLVKS